MTDMANTADRKPSKRARVKVADLEYIVRVPEQPSATQAFTAVEHDQAIAYAAETGGTVQNI